MDKTKEKISKESIVIWILRIIVSSLFIVSAFSKLLPANSAIFMFEKQIVDLGITNWCYAPLLARAIVAFELFLGIAILQNYLLKQIIVPATFFLLFAFCIHLTITIFTLGNNGSCGCFGELIPMTPLEAIIKNVICMAMLAYIYIKIKPTEKIRFVYPIIIFIVAYLFVFIAFQPKCCCASPSVTQTIITEETGASEDTTLIINETTTENIQEIKKDSLNAKNSTIIPAKSARKKVNSVFSKYTKFNTGTVDLNSGKKIVCMFSLDCDHCMISNKILQSLKKKHADFPGVYILALGEEDAIESFFIDGGGKFPYSIIPPYEFFPLLEKANSPPRIVVMDNGNILDEFINFEKLDTNAVMRAVRK